MVHQAYLASGRGEVGLIHAEPLPTGFDVCLLVAADDSEDRVEMEKLLLSITDGTGRLVAGHDESENVVLVPIPRIQALSLVRLGQI